MLLVLSLAACKHINLCFNERAWRGTDLLSATDPFEMREMFLVAARESADPMMFTLSRPQLRALDMMLTDSDPREGKLPDGSPVMSLVETIWNALLEEAGHARHEDRDAHLIAHEDDREAVH